MTDRPTAPPRFGDSPKWNIQGTGRRGVSGGVEQPATEPALALPIGSVLALIGGLALLAAFYMPWFAIQGLLLSGDFLARFLGNPAQLRQFAPALAGNPSDVQLLRALVYLFPLSGLLATGLALAHGLWRASPLWLGVLLSLSGLVSLAALLGGVTRLPPGATTEIGLWTLGAGSAAILLGPWLDRLLARSRRRP
ncbi:MAG: hypothetical protein M3O34_12830 [Chloroflexota bacterium]|nr:hypothetical protein [Chloroflexota bacterium]